MNEDCKTVLTVSTLVLTDILVKVDVHHHALEVVVIIEQFRLRILALFVVTRRLLFSR